MNLNLFALFLATAGILIASTLQAQHAQPLPADLSDEIVSGVSFELAPQRKSAISEVGEEKGDAAQKGNSELRPLLFARNSQGRNWHSGPSSLPNTEGRPTSPQKEDIED